MSHSEAPELPAVEYLCNQIGASLGIPVADFFMIEWGGQLVFVTENFMDKHIGCDLQHLYHFRKTTQHDCKSLLAVIEKHARSHQDISVLIRTLLFDALIGNHDRHGRNLALIVGLGKTRLSPIYDNVSYLGLESGEMLKSDFHPTGRVCTSKTQTPSMIDYVEEFNRLGYQSIVHDFFKRVDKLELKQRVEKSFCSLLMKQAFHALLHKRIQELSDAFRS